MVTNDPYQATQRTGGNKAGDTAGPAAEPDPALETLVAPTQRPQMRLGFAGSLGS